MRVFEKVFTGNEQLKKCLSIELEIYNAHHLLKFDIRFQENADKMLVKIRVLPYCSRSLLFRNGLKRI